MITDKQILSCSHTYTLIKSFFFFLIAFSTPLHTSEEASLETKYVEYETLGYNKLPPDLKYWIWREQTTFEKLRRKIRKDRSHEFSKIFKTLEKTHMYLKKPTLIGRSKENKKKNKYPNHIPYDDTRALRHQEGFYYNASEVITPSQLYIVAAAPQENTVDDFWRLIIDNDIETVVSLVTPYEKGKHNLVEYWSTTHLPHKTRDNWTISLLSDSLCREKFPQKKSPSPNPCIYLRRFSLEKKNMNPALSKKKNITQIHYWNWPDGGTPDEELFQDLLHIVDSVTSRHSGVKPILVHCAAGIGRSGVFVLAHSVQKELMNRVRTKTNLQIHPINLALRLLALRHQRAKLISSHKQYRAALQSIAKTKLKED